MAFSGTVSRLAHLVVSFSNVQLMQYKINCTLVMYRCIVLFAVDFHCCRFVNFWLTIVFSVMLLSAWQIGM